MVEAFETLKVMKVTNWKKNLFSLNVDGAIHRRLVVMISEDVPWVMLVHCLSKTSSQGCF